MENPENTDPSPVSQEAPGLEAAETPNVDTRSEETIEDRRKQTHTKGKLALARIKLNQRLRNETSVPNEHEKTNEDTTNEAPTDNNETTNVHAIDLTINRDSTNNESQDCEAESEIELSESSEYKNLERWYRGLRRPTIEDTIKWQSATYKEETRKKRLLNRKNLEENDQEPVDNQLFCSEDEREAPASSGEPDKDGDDQPVTIDLTSSETPNRDKPTNKRRKTNRISAEERRGSQQLGLDIALSRAKRTGKQSFGETISGTRSLGGRPNRKRKINIGNSVHGKPQNKKRRSKANDVDFGSLFQTDIIADAHESSTKPVHTFTKKNKDSALAELIASIPTADRKDAVPDKRLILEATRKFTRPAKSDDPRSSFYA
ncbi:hypothetical protein Plec18167_008184 [Paecilomyces lecythidis]|uniref:Uncharacterized protein n=1 Tax=Paecilomyces lecythidis TaxID=3004212 RepID=A0ABR3WY32_9EURO